MGADVMRFMYCDHVPQQNLNFGYGPANEVKRRLLTFWNSVSFFVLYANIEGFKPTYRDLAGGPDLEELRPLDRWLLARTQQLVAGGDRRLRALLDAGCHGRMGALHRRPLQLVHPPLAQALLHARRGGVQDALVRPRPGGARDRAGDAVPRRAPVAEPRGVRSRRRRRARSSRAGRSRRRATRTPGCSAEVADARRVAELARAARDAAGIKLRQPLRRLVVATSDAGRRMLISRQVEDLAAELRVKEVAILESPGEVAEMRAKPRLDLVGPRYGPNLPSSGASSRRAASR